MTPKFAANLTALVLSALYFATGTEAVSCAVCAPTIFFEGLTRTLTLTREDTGNTVQCNYDTPAISGFSPACLYRNIDGVLTFTNTGGACPSPVSIISKSSC